MNAGLPPTPKLKDEPRSPNLTRSDGNIGFPREKGEKNLSNENNRKNPQAESTQDYKGPPSAQNNGYKKITKYIRDKEKNPKAYESALPTHTQKKRIPGRNNKNGNEVLRATTRHFSPTSFPSLENDFQPRI